MTELVTAPRPAAGQSPPLVYHVLPEAEVFSEHLGGATSRWVANVVRDDERARVVCARADRTWGLPCERVIVVAALAWYLRALQSGRGRIPWRARAIACRIALGPLAARVRAGDTIYIHNRPELVAVFRALLVRKAVRIVLHMHNSHLVTYPRKVTTAATADLTVFCSRFLEAEARAQLPDLRSTAVVANGADPALFHPPDDPGPATAADEPPVALFVGRLVPEKGVHVFVAALTLLERRGIRVRGRIVGSADFGSDADTPYVRKLHDDAPPNVEFLPYRSGRELAQAFRDASIFCCPSVWNEAFGMVNVEAMASGLPVVATDVGGIADIFSAGGALLVPPDSVDALAEAIAALALDRGLRRRLGHEGYESFVRRFDWEIIRDRYRELISRAATQPLR